ncbi:MAG TPA: hypothetical protein VFI42_05620 [Thermomicrobiaceae bacterium]|nr:hypothetical protein [Thermomicrobiaceae bacterium]
MIETVPATLHDFFVASSGASAALIGLLFVAVSVAPERVFGPGASGERTYRAGSAFFVLSNGLFISLGALLPQLNLGNILVLIGAGGLINILLLIVELWQRGARPAGHGLLLALGSVALYAGEVRFGIDLLRHPNDQRAVDAVTYMLLAGYVIGLARAWQLVGGQDASLIMTVLRRRHADASPAVIEHPAGDTQPPVAGRSSPRRTNSRRTGRR